MNISILLLILPTLIAGQIRINILPASEGGEAIVSTTGNEFAAADTIDLKTFHLTKNEVTHNLERLDYKKPGNLHVNQASSNGHRDLFIKLKPVGSRVIRVDDQPVTFQKKELYNTAATTSVFKANLKHTAKESIRSKWHETQDISIGRNIDIQFSDRRITRTSAWGQDDYETKTVQLAPSSDTEISLLPEQKAVADIHAVKSTLEVRIDYEVSLEGDMYFEYPCVQLFHLWCVHSKVFDINEYFDLLDFRGVFKAHQIITVEYFSNTRVTIKDASTGVVFQDNHISK